MASNLYEQEQIFLGFFLNLEIPEGVEIVDDLTKVIVSIGHARVIEVEEETEEDLLLEGEADEPEVIGRGKEEESGESAGE